MNSFEVMQKIEAQALVIGRARSVMTAMSDLIESECLDISRGEQLLNLSCVVDDQLLNAFSELYKVVNELELKFKIEKGLNI